MVLTAIGTITENLHKDGRDGYHPREPHPVRDRGSDRIEALYAIAIARRVRAINATEDRTANSTSLRMNVARVVFKCCFIKLLARQRAVGNR
jgi:hypothetical protein